jgi:alkylated DNA repair protein alkB family protein 6
MAHEDGPSYFPLVAILSLGASAVVRFTRKRHFGASAGEGAHNTAESQVSLVLRPRSLLLFSGAAYTGELVYERR